MKKSLSLRLPSIENVKFHDIIYVEMGNKEKPVENALCPFSYGRMSRISGVG
jgi:hypothetical protein